MTNLSNVIFLGLVGIISTGLGGLIFSFVRIKNKLVLAMLYQITAGIMTSIVCFGMLNESNELGGAMLTVIGIIIGVFLVILIELASKKKNSSSISVTIAMAVHNIVEGLAIGASYAVSKDLGRAILISIALHNIPEGMVVGILNKENKKVDLKPVISSMIVGAFLGVGGAIGDLIGSVSNVLTAACLSIASGAMLYIVSCDLIPESNSIIISKKVAIFFIVGIILGIIIIK